jgi:hypothetical protein
MKLKGPRVATSATSAPTYIRSATCLGADPRVRPVGIDYHPGRLSTSAQLGATSNLTGRGRLPSGDPADKNRPRELNFLKNQYGSLGETIVLQYRDGLFLPAAAPGSLEKLAADQAADNLFLELFDKFQSQGRRVSHSKTANNFAPSAFAKDPKVAKMPGIRKTLAEAMERLFEAGRIRVENYGKASNPHTHLTRCAPTQEEK